MGKRLADVPQRVEAPSVREQQPVDPHLESQGDVLPVQRSYDFNSAENRKNHVVTIDGTVKRFHHSKLELNDRGDLKEVYYNDLYIPIGEKDPDFKRPVLTPSEAQEKDPAVLRKQLEEERTRTNDLRRENQALVELLAQEKQRADDMAEIANRRAGPPQVESPDDTTDSDITAEHAAVITPEQARQIERHRIRINEVADILNEHPQFVVIRRDNPNMRLTPAETDQLITAAANDPNFRLEQLPPNAEAGAYFSRFFATNTDYVLADRNNPHVQLRQGEIEASIDAYVRDRTRVRRTATTAPVEEPPAPAQTTAPAEAPAVAVVPPAEVQDTDDNSVVIQAPELAPNPVDAEAQRAEVRVARYPATISRMNEYYLGLPDLTPVTGKDGRLQLIPRTLRFENNPDISPEILYPSAELIALLDVAKADDDLKRRIEASIQNNNANEVITNWKLGMVYTPAELAARGLAQDPVNRKLEQQLIDELSQSMMVSSVVDREDSTLRKKFLEILAENHQMSLDEYNKLLQSQGLNPVDLLNSFYHNMSGYEQKLSNRALSVFRSADGKVLAPRHAVAKELLRLGSLYNIPGTMDEKGLLAAISVIEANERGVNTMIRLLSDRLKTSANAI